MEHYRRPEHLTLGSLIVYLLYYEIIIILIIIIFSDRIHKKMVSLTLYLIFSEMLVKVVILLTVVIKRLRIFKIQYLTGAVVGLQRLDGQVPSTSLLSTASLWRIIVAVITEQAFLGDRLSYLRLANFL